MTVNGGMTGKTNGRLWGHMASNWAKYQECTIEPVFDLVLEKTSVGPATRYLDLGCGSGMAAVKAGERGAEISGLDASEALLGIARQRMPDSDLRVGDLEDLPYEDNRFDVVAGFNSFQYAGNPVKALTEAKRVVTPKGIVAIVTWGDPNGMDAAQIVAALKPLLPPPPPGAPGPFALSDETALREFALAGSLEPVECFDVESPWNYKDATSALKGLSSSGVAAKAINEVGLDAVNKAHADAIAPFSQPDGSIQIGARFRVLLTRPTE